MQILKSSKYSYIYNKLIMQKSIWIKNYMNLYDLNPLFISYMYVLMII